MQAFDVAKFSRQGQGKFGSTLYYFRTLESTNLLAFKLAAQKAEEGTLVLADQQIAGKGRSGRSWFSPAGVNLYFTFIARPRTTDLHYLPFMAALAVVRAFEKIGLQADLKWPNDLLVNSKKICGILIETSMEENCLQFAVIGWGINVNVREFPAEIAEKATSIAIEKGGEIAREIMLASLLFEFESLYEKINVMNWDRFCSELEKHSSYLRDCPVQLDQGETSVEGVTRGLDVYGGLILDTPEGVKTFYAGDVQSCRKK